MRFMRMKGYRGIKGPYRIVHRAQPGHNAHRCDQSAEKGCGEEYKDTYGSNVHCMEARPRAKAYFIWVPFVSGWGNTVCTCTQRRVDLLKAINDLDCYPLDSNSICGDVYIMYGLVHASTFRSILGEQDSRDRGRATPSEIRIHW